MISELRSRVESNKPYKLIDMKLYITKRCNQRCIMCSGWTKRWPKKEELTLSEIDSILDQGRKLGLRHVTIFGGEPTLRKDLPDIIQIATNLGLRTELITNGYLMSRSLAFECVRKGLGEVLFSLDSPHANVHDEIRGVSGSYDRIIDAVRFIKEAKSAFNSNIVVITHTALQKRNFDTFPELLELVHKLGVDDVAFSPLCPMELGLPSEHKFNPERLGLSREEIFYYNKKVIPEIEKKSIKYGFGLKGEKVNLFGRTEVEIDYATKFQYSTRFHNFNYCFMPWYHVTIRQNGHILPCNKLRNHVMGNIRTTSLKEVWFSREYEKIRQRCKVMGRKFKECYKCSWHIARRHFRVMRLLYDHGFREKFLEKNELSAELFPRYILGSRFRLSNRKI